MLDIVTIEMYLEHIVFVMYTCVLFAIDYFYNSYDVCLSNMYAIEQRSVFY